MITLFLRMGTGERIKDNGYSISGPTCVASGILFKEQVSSSSSSSFSVHLECFRILQHTVKV